MAAPFTAIAGWLKSIWEWLGGLLNGISEILQFLFIPDSEIMGRDFTNIKVQIDEKVPVLGQIMDIVGNIVDKFRAKSGDDTPPNVEFTYRGVKLKLIDFDIISPYMSTVHAIMITVIYVMYIWRVYKRILPSMLR